MLLNKRAIFSDSCRVLYLLLHANVTEIQHCKHTWGNAEFVLPRASNAIPAEQSETIASLNSQGTPYADL